MSRESSSIRSNLNVIELSYRQNAIINTPAATSLAAQDFKVHGETGAPQRQPLPERIIHSIALAPANLVRY